MNSTRMIAPVTLGPNPRVNRKQKIKRTNLVSEDQLKGLSLFQLDCHSQETAPCLVIKKCDCQGDVTDTSARTKLPVLPFSNGLLMKIFVYLTEST